VCINFVRRFFLTSHVADFKSRTLCFLNQCPDYMDICRERDMFQTNITVQQMIAPRPLRRGSRVQRGSDCRWAFCCSKSFSKGDGPLCHRDWVVTPDVVAFHVLLLLTLAGQLENPIPGVPLEDKFGLSSDVVRTMLLPGPNG